MSPTNLTTTITASIIKLKPQEYIEEHGRRPSHVRRDAFMRGSHMKQV